MGSNRKNKYVQMLGADEINAALRRVGGKEGKKVVRTALREALKPMQDRAKALAPVDKGRLRRSIKIRAKKNPAGIGFVLKLDRGDTPSGRAYYGAVQEYGSKKKHIKGKHFMQQAFDEMKEPVKFDAEHRILTGLIDLAEGGGGPATPLS